MRSVADFDAVVVGAGPAGSTAARELAAGGARVLIVDRAEFPRYKACGGGIPIRTERMLPFPIDSVVEDSVHLLDVAWRGRMRFLRDSGEPFAHMVMRDRFDALLLEHARRAGAEFRARTTVQRAEQDGVVSIESEDGFRATCDFVVCADGAHSPVGKMLGLGSDIAECAAWEVEVHGGARQDDYRSRALIEVGYRPWGYAWLFPKDELLSIGVVLPREQAPRMKRVIDAYRRRLGLEAAEVHIARGHKIRFRRGNEVLMSGRALLAGDAAGLADEFTEEGISYAVHSGRIAARNILRATKSGDLSGYEHDVDAEIMPELRAARIIGYMFYGMLGRAPRPWMLASGKLPFLWDAFFAVQRGESTYARELQRAGWLSGAAERLMRRTWH
jgi:geranylgeranyl reductase family protein